MPHKKTGASQKIKAFQAVMKAKMLACIYLLMSLQSKKAIEHQNETASVARLSLITRTQR